MVEEKVKLPPGRVFQLPTELERLYEGLEDVGVGPRYMGHLRKGEWHLELGGPKHDYVSTMTCRIISEPGIVQDGKVEVIGPDINEIEPETSLPAALDMWVYGPGLNIDWTEYIIRGMMFGLLYTEGMMAVGGGRELLWIRVGKKMAPKLSLLKIAQAIRASLLTMCNLAEAVQIRWVIGAPEVGGIEPVKQLAAEAKELWDGIDALHRGISDEDVDTFYGCYICRMIAPNHACIITPDILPYCGVLSYYSCKSVYETDPAGYIFQIARGDAINSAMGEYTGVNEAIWEKSGQRHKRFWLHSTIKYPTTN